MVGTNDFVDLRCCCFRRPEDSRAQCVNACVRPNREKIIQPPTSTKRLNHETRVQKAKEIAKKWKEEREVALKADPPKEPPPMPIDAIDPGNFIEPRLYATDPTIERLGASAASKAARDDFNPRRIKRPVCQIWAAIAAALTDHSGLRLGMAAVTLLSVCLGQ